MQRNIYPTHPCRSEWWHTGGNCEDNCDRTGASSLTDVLHLLLVTWDPGSFTLCVKTPIGCPTWWVHVRRHLCKCGTRLVTSGAGLRHLPESPLNSMHTKYYVVYMRGDGTVSAECIHPTSKQLARSRRLGGFWSCHLLWLYSKNTAVRASSPSSIQNPTWGHTVSTALQKGRLKPNPYILDAPYHINSRRSSNQTHLRVRSTCPRWMWQMPITGSCSTYIK